MKTSTVLTPSRDAKVDARCSHELKSKLIRFAAIREIDLSDLVREALREKVMRLEQQQAV